MTLFKKCHNCGAEVPEDHKGACPKCGETKGYAITKVVNESVTIDDFVSAEKKALSESYNSILKYYNHVLEEFKNNKELWKNLKNLRDSLESKEDEYTKIAELKAKEKYKEAERKGETRTKTFTVDAIIGTPEQQEIKKLQDLLTEEKKKAIELQAKVDAERIRVDEFTKLNELIANQGKTIKDIRSRLSPKQTIGLALVIGFIASIGGAIVFRIAVEPIIINSVNATLP